MKKHQLKKAQRSEAIRDANLDLLIRLGRHLKETEQLKAAYDKLVSLAKPPNKRL